MRLPPDLAKRLQDPSLHAKLMSADEAEMSSGVSGSRLRRLILRLNEPALDADRARDLVLRLRPLRNRLPQYQMSCMHHASSFEANENEIS